MIVHNLPELAKVFKRVAEDASFAGAVALTKTAQLGQAEVKKHLEKKFNLKNSWTARGIRITPATKKNLQSEIYTLDDYIAYHDKGAVRSDRKDFLVPGKGFQKVTGIDPKKRVIPKKFKRPAVFKKQFPIKVIGGKGSKGKAKPFVLKLRSGKEMIAVRQTSKEKPLDILYYIHKGSIKLKGRRFFEQPTENIYNKKFQEEYDKAFEKYVKFSL